MAHRKGDTRSLRDPAWNRVLYNGRANEPSVVADETRTERRTGEKPQRRIQVEQIIIRQRLSMQLFGQPLDPIHIERRPLLRIRTVPQALGKGQCQRQRARQIAREYLSGGGEIMGDRHVVFGGAFEGRNRELAAQRRRHVVRFDRGTVLCVLGGMGEHGNVLEILCRRSKQRDSAHVNLFDRLLEGSRIASDRRFKWIEVDGNRYDLWNCVCLGLRQVLGLRPVIENRAEDFGMKRFHAALEERRKAGEFFHVVRRYAALFQKSTRSTGRIDVDVTSVQREREFGCAGFVRERKERGLSP